MNGEIRRAKIENILKSSAVPVPGVTLAKDLDVSRQIIVSDIALLRANGLTILSTNKGYIIPKQSACQRGFKVIHTDDQVGEELSLIVDNGGVVKDVFVYHKVYGVIRADMNIRTRRNVKKFLEGLSSGSSSLLKNVNVDLVRIESFSEFFNRLCDESGYLVRVRQFNQSDPKRSVRIELSGGRTYSVNCLRKSVRQRNADGKEAPENGFGAARDGHLVQTFRNS